MTDLKTTRPGRTVDATLSHQDAQGQPSSHSGLRRDTRTTPRKTKRAVQDDGASMDYQLGFVSGL